MKELQQEQDLAQLLSLVKPKSVFGENTEIIESTHYSLFVEEETIELEAVNVDLTEYLTIVQDDSTRLQLSSIIENGVSTVSLKPEPIVRRLYTLYLSDMVHDHDTGENADTFKIIQAIDNAGPNDELIIHVNNDGGYIDDGLQLINRIKRKFGNRIITYIDPIACSMATYAVLCGSVRIASIDSSFMLHQWAGMAGGIGTRMLESIKHDNDRFNAIAYREYVKTSIISEKEFDEYKLGKEIWCDISEIVKRGICTHVLSESGLLVPIELIPSDFDYITGSLDSLYVPEYDTNE